MKPAFRLCLAFTAIVLALRTAAVGHPTTAFRQEIYLATSWQHVSSTATTAQTHDASSSSNYDIAEFHNVMIPMRDGVHLATNIFRPVENGKPIEGKFPVILERTPYGKDNDVYYANHWVKQGYVVILQDVRGRFNSEGTFLDSLFGAIPNAENFLPRPLGE